MSATLGAGAGTLVRLLAPEPERTAESGEDRGDRGLVQSRVLSAPRHGCACLLLPEPLRDLPNTPAEHGVPSIDNPHSPLSFRTERTKVPFNFWGLTPAVRSKKKGSWGNRGSPTSGDEGTSVLEDSGDAVSLRRLRACCPGCRTGPGAASASASPSRACGATASHVTDAPGGPR